MKTENVKIIFSAGLARELLRRNYEIIDVKPNRNFMGRTVFIFKDVDGLKQEIRELTKNQIREEV